MILISMTRLLYWQRAKIIEIVENKPLARMLYANVDVGQLVPPELYQAVAEVLAFVYQIKGKI